MNRSSHTLTIPLNPSVIAVVLLWLVAVGLLVWDTFHHTHGNAGEWALFLGMSAAVWTAALLMAHTRRVVLEVVSWEHRQTRANDGGGSSDGDNVDGGDGSLHTFRRR